MENSVLEKPILNGVIQGDWHGNENRGGILEEAWAVLLPGGSLGCAATCSAASFLPDGNDSSNIHG